MPDIILDVGDNAKYKGECDIDGFNDCIVCDSFSFGATQALDLGRGTNRTLGTTSCSEIQITRQFDSTSTSLLHSLFQGEIFPLVKIHFLKSAGTDNKSHVEFLRVELTNALFSGFTNSGSGGPSVMMESLSIGYTAIKYVYMVQKEDGTLDGQKTASFELDTQKSAKG